MVQKYLDGDLRDIVLLVFIVLLGVFTVVGFRLCLLLFYRQKQRILKLQTTIPKFNIFSVLMFVKFLFSMLSNLLVRWAKTA